MRVRRYAEDTTVPISRSRGEIDAMLRAWGATGIQWTDEFDVDRVTLAFVWPRGEQRYHARFTLALPSEAELEPHARDGRNGAVSAAKLAKLMDARGKHEHRVLLLWLKAALNAIEAGIVDAEAIFLPFLVMKNGSTAAEEVKRNPGALLTSSAQRLLAVGS